MIVPDGADPGDAIPDPPPSAAQQVEEDGTERIDVVGHSRRKEMVGRSRPTSRRSLQGYEKSDVRIGKPRQTHQLLGNGIEASRLDDIAYITARLPGDG